MLVLGIILVLLAAGAILAALVAAPAQTATFDLGAFSLEMNTVGVFFAGAGAVVLLAIGLELIRSGLRRANQRRKEKKELNRLSKLEARSGTAAGASGSTATNTDTSTGTDSTATREERSTRDGGTTS